jgi:hypothetical protein
MQLPQIFRDTEAAAPNAPVVMVRKRRIVQPDHDQVDTLGSASQSDPRAPRVYTLAQTRRASAPAPVHSVDEFSASPPGPVRLRPRRRSDAKRPGAVTILMVPVRSAETSASARWPDGAVDTPVPSATPADWAKLAQRLDTLNGVIRQLLALRHFKKELRALVGERMWRSAAR